MYPKTKAQLSGFRFDKEERRNGFEMIFKENRRELNEVRDDVCPSDWIRTSGIQLPKSSLDEQRALFDSV